MTQLRTALKSRLARRDFVIGLAPKFSSPDLIAALAPRIDYVFLDCENAGPDVERIPDLVRAAQAGGAAALLRPWSKDPGVLRRYLGCGIDGFIMPDVETPQEIAAVRALMRDIRPDEADTLLYLALIETQAGVANARDLMLAEGCDATQIGTSDLAVSFGLPRRGDHAQVREVAFGLLDLARSLGKSAGCPVNKYGLKPVIDAGGNCVMLFMADVLTAGLDAAMTDWPRR
ncbi:aldolase/citrate lyase family protein [Pseudorhodoplanes sp.]|uniref:aldolase/citrate lyase family protein n=1 Tax=Pseudorhodoplanes sp. TaxID=1934341 RepID=UPI002C730A15|nr:aldolase/citrate lyase family protein [Pseudorhodoplanes sp.]HWV41662.1 aldolase/citrate lyase family protein [Pseudorhodoplanes sp.]